MSRDDLSGKNAKVAAVIQARMGSTRLPGKVLMPIGGSTLLAHIVHRLRQVPAVDLIAVATTEQPEDERIADHCRELHVPCVRGSEEDVLSRYILAAERLRAAILVRATGDNPMIDPGSVHRAVSALQSGGFDFVLELGMPRGCCGEAFTYEALCRARELAVRAEHREHVTLLMKQDPGRFKSCMLTAPEACRRPEVNLSIDTEEEYRQVKLLMESGRQPALSISTAEILAGLSDLTHDRAQLSAP